MIRSGKDVAGQRLTYILRPNVTRPSFEPPRGLDTPPVTDSSVFDSDTDFAVSDRDSHASDLEVDSDAEPASTAAPPVRRGLRLDDIPESNTGSPAASHASLASPPDDSWSIISESDMDGEADVELDLAGSVSSLDLNPDVTPRAARTIRTGPLRSHLWDRQRRSASSPSRSPARRPPPRVRQLSGKKAKVKRSQMEQSSFYDYLFS